MTDVIKKKKYRIGALGCRTNQYEAQAFRDQLTALGYEPAGDDEEADLSIVNTCTVTESADSNSRHLIRDYIRKSPSSKVVVTGCLAERDPNALVQISGVSSVINNHDKEKLVQLLHPGEEIPEFSIKQFEAHTRAFVKVQDGCNSFCTYCIIPYVRGRSRSRQISEVVEEVEALIKNGYKEVVITGINVGDFDGGGRLCDLVSQVDQIAGLKRLRVSSIDPDEVDDALTNAIIHGKTTCNSMHVVLQSGSNVILKRMNRKYTRQQFFETVRRLRSIDPNFTITTDIIVGFPGETESDFQETLDVMREVQFAKVHMFPYSDRPRTKSATYTNKVPHDVIQRRKSELLKLAEETSFMLREKYVGRTMSVLTEAENEGHTTNFLPVIISEGVYPANEIVMVECIANSPKGLIGKVVSP